jgi:hypothetical protein
MAGAGLNTASTPVLLSKNTQAGLLDFHRQCYQQYNSQWNLREQMRDIDLAYAREMDLTVENQRAKIANRYGDKDRFQNITIPIVMPQVEAAVTYQSSVFLTGIPLFGVSASPEWENEALQMETIIDNQATRGGWTRELTMFFRDGFKYNISALECCWAREVTWLPETNIAFDARIAKPKEVIWEGNKLKRWDMYNTFFDNRVNPAEMHLKGDFVGNTEVMSRIRLKQFINSLPDARLENIKEAFESGMGAISISTGASGGIENYYVPQINPRAMLTPALQGAFNWESWAGVSGAKQGIEYKNMYEVTTMYARIMPSDFNMKLPEQNTPQIWKLIFVNHQVLIYAERQTNAHNMLPVLFGQPLEDGLGYQTKSLADNVSPIQDITSALSNSTIAARRRAISDRTLYDPSRVTEAHINNANPSAKIPVRPGAYGKPVSDAVHAFPFRDDQAPYVAQLMQQYGAMANMISGQNPVRQGQFVKGNKTTSEFDTVMGNANGRDQMIAMGYESQIFTPLKEILKINTLQYQGGISLYNREKKTDVKVDPVALRTAVMQFKMSDGLTPTDKIMDSDMLAVALQQIGSSPVIGAGYNIAPMFSYLMKLKGAELTPFEKSPQQQAYEQAMGQYQQMVMQLYKQNPEQDPAMLPPAPLPQQFGYDPAKQAGSPATNEPSTITSEQPQ